MSRYAADGPKPQTLYKLATAAYVLRVLDGQGKPYANAALGLSALGEFVLPLPPQRVNYSETARRSLYVQYDHNTADEQGLNPPTITLQGTFGRQTRGAYDGFEWQRQLEDLIRWYMQANCKAGLERTPFYSLEWHDTLRDEHWTVTPDGTPLGNQDSSSPTRESYDLRLTALEAAQQSGYAARSLPAELRTDVLTLCPQYPRCKAKKPASSFKCPFWLEKK